MDDNLVWLTPDSSLHGGIPVADRGNLIPYGNAPPGNYLVVRVPTGEVKLLPLPWNHDGTPASSASA